MDRIGRRPVIAGGYLLRPCGCSLTALATNIDSTPLVISRLRAHRRRERHRAADPDRGGRHVPAFAARRGISYVLFGSVFGAILGPAVFGPLFAGREVDAARR